MSKVFEAVADYEIAAEAESHAGVRWRAALEATNRALGCTSPQVRKTGEVDWFEERLLWRLCDADAAPIDFAAAPVEAREVAINYDLQALFDAWQAAERKLEVARDVMLRTPCQGDRDVLEKLRGLAVDGGGGFPSLMTLVRTKVGEAGVPT